MKYANGNKYEGNWITFRHGYGVMTYASGEKYAGTWSAGKKNGRGILTLVNGDKYEGYWEDDKWKRGKKLPSVTHKN